MLFTRASKWSYCGVLTAAVEASSLLPGMCGPAVEGECRGELGSNTIEICAADRWQQLDTSSFHCVAGTMVPYAVASTASPPAVQSGSDASITNAFDPQPLTDTTGYAYCNGLPLARREDQWGRASYHRGGKMASVYYADASSSFHCDRPPPLNDHYVAFWTQYDGATISQPTPLNCNRTLSLTNRRLGKTANATVIDRCASCVGVGRQLDDPTTPDCLVNGATIDLSRTLWDFLFEGAPPGVYDIEYDGNVYAGWATDPTPLTRDSGAQCNST